MGVRLECEQRLEDKVITFAWAQAAAAFGGAVQGQFGRGTVGRQFSRGTVQGQFCRGTDEGQSEIRARAGIVASGESPVIACDLRFSQCRRSRLISFSRLIGEPTRSIFFATIVAIAMLVCYSHSLLILPPTFHFSHALALIGSFWGPDFVWVIALYCGYKTRKLLENMPLLALVTICVVIVSLFLATQ